MFIYLCVFLILHEFCVTFNFLSLSLKSISPEDSEKRRTNYQAYRSYLNREGPKALGSKEIPKVRGLRGCVRASGLWVHVCIHYVYSSRESIIKSEHKSLSHHLNELVVFIQLMSHCLVRRTISL